MDKMNYKQKWVLLITGLVISALITSVATNILYIIIVVFVLGASLFAFYSGVQEPKPKGYYKRIGKISLYLFISLILILTLIYLITSGYITFNSEYKTSQLRILPQVIYDSLGISTVYMELAKKNFNIDAVLDTLNRDDKIKLLEDMEKVNDYFIREKLDEYFESRK